MCVPKANHRRLIDECYPPPKQLAAAAPDFKPNSNELSRLTYYANAKPTKLTKVLAVLQTKAAASARGLGGSGAAADKSKAGLMITLGVLKQLILDCRSHLSYFAPAAQAIIATALDAAAKPTAAGHRDLDVSARAASTFYALANYMDKESSASDAKYAGLLRSFASMATEGGRDEEEQTRARLIGLGAIAGAVGSDALYSTAFAKQVGTIVPALLANMTEKAAVDLAFLRTEGAKAADGSQVAADYASKRRPVGVRRAPSLSAAAGGEKAPAPRDAASAAMGTMQSLLHHGDASHVQAAIACVVSHLDASGAWRAAPWCAWLAEALTSWTAQPYRFVVLTFFVEHLVETETSAQAKKADTLVLMISTLLRSKLSLIGLSTSDTISNLLGLAVRRTHAAPDDELLPALIDCVGALGAHTYYADQANDCADEICARISALLLPDTDVAEAAKTSFGNAASRRPIKTGDRARDESLRVLLCCLASLVDSANVPSRKSGTGASARPRMSPDTLAPTCALLASPNPRVRLTYHQTVLFFLQREAGPASDTLPSAAVAQQKEATAFLHAWAAGAFVLSLARGLSIPQGTSETPLSALPILDRSNAEGVRGPAPETAAQPVDYAGLTAAADAMARYLPVPATLGLVPGLLALDRAAGTRLSAQGAEGQRLSAARAFVAATLATMAEVWESSSLARSAKASLDAHNILTSFPADMPELDAAHDFVPFPGGSAGAASDRGLDARSVAQALAQSSKLQREASLSEEELQSWLLRDWNVQIAVDDSLIGASPFRSSFDGAAARPFAGDRADGGSGSEADVGAPRGVGVDDFREALGSRSYASKRRTNGELGHGAPNGSSDPRTERRTSRRVSRKEAAAPAAGVPALLDDLHVGVAEESGADGEQRPALVAPALS